MEARVSKLQSSAPQQCRPQRDAQVLPSTSTQSAYQGGSIGPIPPRTRLEHECVSSELCAAQAQNVRSFLWPSESSSPTSQRVNTLSLRIRDPVPTMCAQPHVCLNPIHKYPELTHVSEPTYVFLDPTYTCLTPQMDPGPWDDAEKGCLPINVTTQVG